MKARPPNSFRKPPRHVPTLTEVVTEMPVSAPVMAAAEEAEADPAAAKTAQAQVQAVPSVPGQPGPETASALDEEAAPASEPAAPALPEVSAAPAFLVAPAGIFAPAPSASPVHAAVAPNLPLAAPGADPVAPRRLWLPDVLEEAVVHRVMQRVDIGLDQRLRDAIATVVQEQTRSLLPRLREEVESVVRQVVYEAMAEEVADRPGRKPH